MLWLYRVLFLPVLLVASPYYLLRMKRRGGYGRNFGQRFGATPALPSKRAGVCRVWLQAVSVGEMLAIGPVLEALKRRPDVEVYLTTTTSTGYKIALERYATLTMGIGYFPLDWWGCSARAWGKIAPDLVILTEGERWPEHIAQAEGRAVPVLCMNARLSDRSFRRMRALRWATRPMLRGLTRVLAAAEHDAARFRELGLPHDRVVVTGNIKLDVAIPLLGEDEKARLRGELGLGSEPVLLGSSTWPGEEAALVKALKVLREAGIAARLLLVPRHAERRGDVEALLKGTEFSFHLRSRGAAPAPVDIAVGDTTGELRKFTQLAEVVFVGKSLPPHGEGQTPVEAAALGRALILGPGMSNFRVIAHELVEVGAARVVSDVAELSLAAVKLFLEAPTRTAMAAAARRWHQTNRGAVERTIAEIETLLPAGAPKR
jgi:3-deoxy-D-manno-octulosonic-acid transferase